MNRSCTPTHGPPRTRLVTQGSLTNLAKVAPAAGISWLVFEVRLLPHHASPSMQGCSLLVATARG